MINAKNALKKSVEIYNAEALTVTFMELIPLNLMIQTLKALLKRLDPGGQALDSSQKLTFNNTFVSIFLRPSRGPAACNRETHCFITFIQVLLYDFNY